MEPENFDVKEQQGIPLNKVTPLSKYLAMLLFIVMPFIGGWLGYTYAPAKVVEVEKIVIIGDSQTKTDTEKVIADEENIQELQIPEGWSTVVNKELGIQFSHPSDWNISETIERKSLDGIPIRLVTVVPPGTDPTVVYFFTTNAQLEEVKNIAIVSTPTTGPLFNEVIVSEGTGLQRIAGNLYNECVQITTLIEKNGTIYGSNIFNCPTHPEGYDKLRDVIAASLQIL